MCELILAVLFGGVVFWLLMLTDWYFHEPKGIDRFIWLMLIMFLSLVGAFAYLCLRYRYNRNKGEGPCGLSDRTAYSSSNKDSVHVDSTETGCAHMREAVMTHEDSRSGIGDII